MVAIMILLAGCGGAGSRAHRSTGVKLPPDYVPVSVGQGPRYRPALRSARGLAGRPVDGLRCGRRAGPRFGAHLEVFAHQHVVAISAGIGLAPPLAFVGSTVRHARCYYPVATTDPTGVLDVRAGSSITLGALFDLWGQPLGPRQVAGFKAPRGERVTAFLGGHRWRADPRRIPLFRHARITLELAGQVLPHRVYLFPPGL